jgi:uncharacterized damage-inducible protein DinB
MGKKELLAMWEKLGRTQEVTLKAVALIPVGRLDWRPCPQVRTVKGLVRHIFAWERLYARAARSGMLTQKDAEKEESTAFKDNRELIAYARRVHKEATGIVKKLSERDLKKRVKFFFGSELSGEVCIATIYDEHWHHRGQLYVYLRLLGVQPPFLYGSE